MIWILANAPAANSSDSNVELVLISFGVFVVIALIGGVPIMLARGNRSRETIVATLILWWLTSAGSISYSIMQQMNWSAEQERRIESGYYDPTDVSDKPKEPVLLWGGLSVVYCVTLVWALQKPKQISEEQQ